MNQLLQVQGVQRLVNNRTQLKMQTRVMLTRIQTQEGLTAQMFERNEVAVRTWCDQVHVISREITELLDDNGIAPDNAERVADANETVNYYADVNQILAEISCRFDQPGAAAAAVGQAGALDAAAIGRLVQGLQANSLTPKIQCNKFSGSPTSDKFAYKNFKTQFENCVRNVPSDAMKLAHLRGYLTGIAEETIAHLTFEDENYNIAIALLDALFLDKPYILDEILRQIANTTPKYDEDFVGVNSYMVKLRADLSELNTSYGFNCFEEGSFGCAFVSHIVFNKLPRTLQKELINKNVTNYPSINQVFATYSEAIKTLVKTKFTKFPKDIKVKTSDQGKKCNYPNKQDHAALEQFSNSIQVRRCKFCNKEGHSMLFCTNYKTIEARQKRLRELQLCELCSNAYHKTSDCNGNQDKLKYACSKCHSFKHIPAVCDAK